MIPYFDPPSIQLGGITVHAYGLLVLLGLTTGTLLALGAAFWRKLPLWPVAMSGVLFPFFALIGGHFAYVLMYRLDEALDRPSLWLEVWAGMSSVGVLPLWGFTAVVMMLIAGFRKLTAQLDVFAIGWAAAWTIGRFGCFLVHDHPGVATDFFLGVQGICEAQRSYSYTTSGACHDLGLYEMLGCGMLFLTAAASFVLRLRPGLSAAAVLIGYGVLRLGLEPLRVDWEPLHVVSALMYLLGGGLVLAAAVTIPKRWPEQPAAKS